VRLWSLKPASPLVFALAEKTVLVKPVRKDKKKAKKDKDEDTSDKADKDKLRVKPDLFGADLDASAVRSSQNVSVLFHVRPAMRLIGCSQVNGCVSKSTNLNS
jgi:hypothetical protein